MKKIQPSEVWEYSNDRIIFDVRSPSEFAHAHIPNALSLPLFNDEERAKVGTLYKQVSAENALIKGLDFVGPKMAGFVKTAIKKSPNRKLLIHCWRGGKRSGSMAWLMAFAGLDVVTLEGGYKNYRHYVLNEFDNYALKIIVLGGKTGSGKTEILKELEQLGEQVIDLEAIAHHKGSAFGWIGEQKQPTVEQFENNLFEVFRKIDPTKRVWVENESRSIGTVFIPQGFWNQMKSSPLIHLEVPFFQRIEHLVNIYTQTSKDDLILSFEKIASKIGAENLKKTIGWIEKGDFETAAAMGLKYYDKTYMHNFEVNTTLQKHILEVTKFNPMQTAVKLIQFADATIQLHSIN